jgi:Transposase DDE domain group 1
LVIDSNPRHFREATPAMIDSMLPLPGLSPVSGKTVVAKFDGGLLSSDGGILVLREIEQRLGVADRLAACMVDPRAPELITHTLAEIIRFRLLMIGAGYEDGNDARFSAKRSHVQDGARSIAVGSRTVFAVDHLPS